MSNLDKQIATLKKCELLSESQVKSLCDKALELFVEEANVEPVYAPVTVQFSKSLIYIIH